MAIRLFQSYFRHSDLARDAELQACLADNLANPALDAVHLLVEPGDMAPEHPRVRAHRVTGRPTFDDFFAVVNAVTGPRDLNVIANSDITLDPESLRLANRTLPAWQCYALSRWEVGPDGPPRLFAEARSQDTWMFRGPIRSVAAPFCLGMPGCDNRLAYLLETGPYRVFNPSRVVRTFHHHTSAVRNYGEADCVPGPYYHPPPDRLYSVSAWVWHRASGRVRRALGLPAAP